MTATPADEPGLHWHLLPPGRRPSSSARFPQADPDEVHEAEHLNRRRLLALTLGGLALVALILIAVTKIVQPAAIVPCAGLSCRVPPSQVPIATVPLTVIGSGVTVRDYPADEPSVLTEFGTPSDGVVEINYHGSSAATSGSLQIGVFPANGLSPVQWVDRFLVTFKGATPDYILPGAWVGYQLGFGEAFQVAPTTASGAAPPGELILMAAVRNGLAVVVLAQGQQVSLVNFDGHPTPARLYVAAYANTVINSIRWPGLPVP
jgi:hypothetical protein